MRCQQGDTYLPVPAWPYGRCVPPPGCRDEAWGPRSPVSGCADATPGCAHLGARLAATLPQSGSFPGGNPRGCRRSCWAPASPGDGRCGAAAAQCDPRAPAGPRRAAGRAPGACLALSSAVGVGAWAASPPSFAPCCQTSAGAGSASRGAAGRAGPGRSGPGRGGGAGCGPPLPLWAPGAALGGAALGSAARRPAAAAHAAGSPSREVRTNGYLLPTAPLSSRSALTGEAPGDGEQRGRRPRRGARGRRCPRPGTRSRPALSPLPSAGKEPGAGSAASPLPRARSFRGAFVRAASGDYAF